MAAGDGFSTIGGSTLAGLGAGATFGPVGAGIGAGVGLAEGILKNSANNKLQKAYSQAEGNIPLYDPNQQAYLSQVRQQERNLRAGTDASSAMAQQLAGNVNAQTQGNLLRAGGTGVVNNLLRAQAGMGNQIAGIGAQAGGQANGLLGAQGTLISNMAERVYQRQQQIRNQALDRAEQGRQDAMNTTMAAIGAAPSIAGGITNPFKSTPQFNGAPSYAQMGNPNALSSYTDRSMGAQVQGLPSGVYGNPNSGWQNPISPNPYGNAYGMGMQPTLYQNNIQTEASTPPMAISYQPGIM